MGTYFEFDEEAFEASVRGQVTVALRREVERRFAAISCPIHGRSPTILWSGVPAGGPGCGGSSGGDDRMLRDRGIFPLGAPGRGLSPARRGPARRPAGGGRT